MLWRQIQSFVVVTLLLDLSGSYSTVVNKSDFPNCQLPDSAMKLASGRYVIYLLPIESVISLAGYDHQMRLFVYFIYKVFYT